MANDLLKLIQNCKFFAALDSKSGVIESILAQFEKICLKEEEVLFEQGDTSDYLYILVSGKLAATLTNATGKKTFVGHIIPGETVGELGALSHEPRSLSVKAIENSILLKLASTAFKKLCQQYPEILYETIQPLIQRSQKTIQMLSIGDNKKHIALIPANEDTHLAEFIENLKNTLLYQQDIYLFIAENASNDEHALEQQISKIEEDYNVILYLITSSNFSLPSKYQEKITIVHIIADANSRPYYDNSTLLILKNSYFLKARQELILLHQNNTPPKNTQEWLAQGNFFLHHQIRINEKKDYRRLLRFFTGKTTALVLSGGGAKGWVHVGALKAILESNFPIDAIGGTSVGAIISGLYALHPDYQSIYNAFDKLASSTRNTISFKNFCWPSIALFNFHNFTQEIKNIFNGVKIEDLWITYFCNTCNLSLYKEVIHREGLMWEKIRGSVSIPGLVPAMIINGQIHLDGGLVNNLPVNIMRDILGFDSKILAVDLVSEIIDANQYNFPPTLTFKQAFLAKLGLRHREYRFPPFLDSFLKSLLIGSSLKQKENGSLANLLINPDTTELSMLSLKKNEKDKLIELGYQAALEKISSWEEKK